MQCTGTYIIHCIHLTTYIRSYAEDAPGRADRGQGQLRERREVGLCRISACRAVTSHTSQESTELRSPLVCTLYTDGPTTPNDPLSLAS